MPNLPNTFNPNLSIEPYRGVGHATAGSASMPIPQAAMLALTLGSGFLNSFLGSRGRKKEQERSERLERDLADQNDRRVRDLADLDVMSEESMADPFRHVIAQIAAAAQADRLARTEPLRQSGTRQLGRYSVPAFEGGALSYDADPELRAAAAAMRTAVLSGQGQAPSVVRPDPTLNPGAPNARTGALDLIARSGRPPVASTMPVGAPSPMPFPSPSPMGPGSHQDVERSMGLPPGSVQTFAGGRGVAPDDDFRLSLEDLLPAPAPASASRARPRRRMQRRF